MERGKSGSGRGSKSKAPQHPVDLFALGAKPSRPELPDAKRPGHPKPGSSHGPMSSAERKREISSGGSGLPLKKSKIDSSSRSGDNSPSAPDSWELVAVDCEVSELVPSVGRAIDMEDTARAKSLICGAIKVLRNQRAKPDKVLYLGLMYLASVMPYLFTSEHVMQALCSLLRRDPTSSFKSKGNPAVPALAANLIFKGFQDHKRWPEIFVKVYVEDSIGERIWVDMEETKGFVDNILTGFNTKPANRSLLPADFLAGPGGRSDSPTISGSAANTDDEGDGDGQAGASGSSKVKLETASVILRYRDSRELVETVVMDQVFDYLNRRQPAETVNRNFLRLLATTCGLTEVRLVASPRLELWLQNPKLMRATQELLLAICANCCSHTPKDIEVINHLMKMRLKTKALTNLYLSGIKELIASHSENLGLVLKLTIYNELSNVRNPNNMPVLLILFQTVPEQAAAVLAENFQDVLMGREDYLRPVRVLLRELVRQLRHDLPLIPLCRALMRERRDPAFREFSQKERVMYGIADLISLCILLAVSPGVREAASLLSRGERREIQTLNNFRILVAKIQRDALSWMYENVPRMFHPAPADFLHTLHKLLFLESPDQYSSKDNWPTENERATMFRLASDVPVLQNTLVRLAAMGMSKEHPVSCPEIIEIIDRILRRAAAIQTEGICPIQVEKTELYELFINLCPYRYADNLILPQGYQPPSLCVLSSYWKVWSLLLILCAHNPSSFGSIGWEKYPTLRMFMEMCITNHFTYPPPTMPLIDEDTREIKLQIIERQQIIELETHLAAASTKTVITEETSLLKDSLMGFDPTGPPRAPPEATLSYLRTLNEQFHLGHKLCRSRKPNFLLDVIQRQGASQAMPWLADLVESSEGAFSHLPVQCLCEFLLSESSLESAGNDGDVGEGVTAVKQRQEKQQQLLAHLRAVLSDLSSPDGPALCCEVLEYFLRRLASVHANSRMLALKGLKILLSPADDDDDDSNSTAHSWLLQQLPALPHFSVARPQVIIALRQACQTENELSAVRAYLQFLAKYAINDPLNELTDLVLDMAQLIVERNTITQALLPCPENDISEPAANMTLHYLIQIFTAYLHKAREPRKEAITWSESQDQILVTWSSGEESTMHILVVHAMVLLITYGPRQDPELYAELVDTWVPTNHEPPKAFLVDTSEEALLIPDWLKLKMIQSCAPGLVDSALADLDPQQLSLFVQSFGIQPPNMSKLLQALDIAVEMDPDGVRESVQDKTYMVQLIQVQHYRGATGGHKFLQLLQEPSTSQLIPPTPNPIVMPVRPPLPSVPPPLSLGVELDEVHWLLSNIFNPATNPAEAAQCFSRLQRALSREIQYYNTDSKPLTLMTSVFTNLKHQLDIAQSTLYPIFVHTPKFSCPLFRLAISIKPCPEPLKSTLLHICYGFVMLNVKSALTDLAKSYVSNEKKEAAKPVVQDDNLILQEGKIETALELRKTKSLIDTATQRLLDQSSDDSSTGLLLDWLSCLEPEMIGSCPDKQMKLLFSREKGGAAACRPYLLTLLTHRSSWATIHMCMTTLLQECNKKYDPGAVLDFLWSLIGNPKLWQGREKRTPKHHSKEDILGLSNQQLCVLLDYLVEEALGFGPAENSSAPLLSTTRQREMLEARVPLLQQCVHPSSLPYLARHLAPSMMTREGPRSRVSRLLLLQLYLSVPALAQHLTEQEKEAMLSGAAVTSRGGCSLDVTSHCLLSALAAGQGKDWTRRSQEFELAARKMAATHPVLVLRQLPMLAASLKGRVHLESSVFRTRGHMLLFTQTLGLLELLQPHIFQTEYAQPLEDILDSFFAMFQLHGHLKDAQVSLGRTITLLQSFVSHDAQRALKYLQRHCHLLHQLHASHPALGLQALLSGLSLPARDGDEPELLVAAAMAQPADLQTQSWAQAQVALVLGRIGKYSQGEDIQGALQELDHISQRRPGVLDACTEVLSSLLLSPAGGARSMAHLLLLRLLRHAPSNASACVPAYLRCLENSNPDIQASALERLPDVIVCSQEHALLLLERLFKLGVRSGVHTAPHISRAVALLQLQSGC